MTSPLKPWERAGMSSQPTESPARVSNDPSRPPTVPRPPPRSNSQSSFNSSSYFPSRYAPQSSPYNSYNYGQGYGSPSSYGYGSSYSPYGSSYSPYGSNSLYSPYGGRSFSSFNEDRPDASEFVRRAEEGSRGAFQSIESIVHAVGSVATMLDSTFHAVYSSFRAVLGVADHFSRLRASLFKIFSAFTLVRALFYVVNLLLRWTGFRKGDPEEAVWREASGSAGGKRQSVTWPFVVFLAVALGGPFLIWRLIRSTVESSSSDEEGGEEEDQWVSGEGEHVVARGLYDYDAGNEDELSFRTGDELRLAPKERQPRVRGWVLAALDGTRGLVPGNYIKILGKRNGKSSGNM